jgi:drug/metabolite transporter (DMT)-like permease
MNTSLDRPKVGILWMLATMFCFIALDACMKHALATYPLMQVTWARFFFATILAAAFCFKDLSRLIFSENIWLQLLRSFLLMVTTGLFNAGIRDVPLATATTVMFLSPILVTLLSIVVLKEKVGWRRWLGIMTGFLGAIIIVDPWHIQSSVEWGVFFLLLAALTNASYQIATRYLRSEDPMTSLIYTAAVGAAVTSSLVPTTWVWPDGQGWLVFVMCGFLGAIGHLFLIRAYRAAPASIVAPFAYSSLIWATLFGYAIWDEWPTANVWIGATLIIAAGLYIFLRERRVESSGVNSHSAQPTSGNATNA